MADNQHAIKANITGGFWFERQQMNAEKAIFHQWEMLEATRCIDNFRIAAGIKEGFREGYFFADSDAYKWLDAASRILANNESPRLKGLVDEFIGILEKAQCEDGYLYTYNQIHFGSTRWKNLQIEHEFYCLGHLIEAGISHKKATGEDKLFAIVKKAANLLVSEFFESPAKFTDGHEEIEIALIRLSRFTGATKYRDLAQRFLERRGKIPGYGLHFGAQFLSSVARMNNVAAKKWQYYKTRGGSSSFRLPAHNKHRIPKLMPLRFASSVLSGKYVQQHKPLALQDEPVGHAVRFSYLNTAAAMLANDKQEDSDVRRLDSLWQHMVEKRMSVSGGIGSLPLTEGFGRDYELDPEIIYNETCAAIGCMLWDHEMALLTGDSKYDDLFEWQLYNAASVGIGLDGCSYFYNNPLTTHGGYKREPWYDIPCCPSNLSRIWASMADYAVSADEEEFRIHHYFGGEFVNPVDPRMLIRMDTSLPLNGSVKIELALRDSKRKKMILRKPAWAGRYCIRLNGEEITPIVKRSQASYMAACGLDFRRSAWLCIEKTFSDGDLIEVEFDMPINILEQDVRIKGCGGKVAISRGPILYCLESINNSRDCEKSILAPGSLELLHDDKRSAIGLMIRGIDTAGRELFFSPYYAWGNCGETAMTAFVQRQV